MIEKHQSVASLCAPTGDESATFCMCPEWNMYPQSFGGMVQRSKQLSYLARADLVLYHYEKITHNFIFKKCFHQFGTYMNFMNFIFRSLSVLLFTFGMVLLISRHLFFNFIFLLLFNYICLYFYPTTCPPPHSSPPPTLEPTPIDFVHVSFLHAP